VLGDINWVKTARKTSRNSMAFIPASTSLPLTSTATLITDDTFLGFELEVDSITQAIKEAKEQLHQVMEVKQEEDIWWWMEKCWEEQMLERGSVVMLVDRKLEREAAKHAGVEIWKKLKVSVGFFSILIFRS